jgi:hypothetical protein
MKLKQEGKSGRNGQDYFDICTNDFKTQFGYIQKQADSWKLYINVYGEKHYFNGPLSRCIEEAERLSSKQF